MSSQAFKTILKINDLTKEGEVKWNTWSFSIDSLTGLERLIGTAYVTKVKEKHFRCYQYESRHYYDEDQFDWVPHYRLEFVDGNGKLEWQFPEESAIEDLYESIQFKISGASDFFSSFLEGDE
ncbi:hypothetical protein ITJ86_16805 [Winogradskyella sp. F6397]|uniref:DUF4178 domain-containing protein n=1 Tax=Winogradskyella marina TaxID=2785530 RepID=A0ABS0EM72_9FLAO|nr:hypothetical protein [Winogradskyella marina]MBF8151564.1 hypothetical protein [Winogradskyella marina]